jgi:tRNA nucleotidyltransferase (CCA-adding enzyme)
MISERWEHFHHESDIGVRGFGSTKAKAFEQAALALTAVITEEEIKPQTGVDISLEGTDLEFLFTDWLNALIFEMATRSMLFSRFEVAIDNSSLRAQAWGEPVNVEKHQPAVEVKGATFTELRVEEIPGGGWLAQCVVDV